jgi:hypothetical protein
LSELILLRRILWQSCVKLCYMPVSMAVSRQRGFATGGGKSLLWNTCGIFRSQSFQWRLVLARCVAVSSGRGYTYDWGNDLTEVGALEFVVSKGAKIRVSLAASNEEYLFCGVSAPAADPAMPLQRVCGKD